MSSQAEGMPGWTLGILGGGQLAQMLALAAVPLGVRVRVLEPDSQAPARLVAEHVRAPYTDAAGLDALAACDAVTLEFENVPVEALAYLEGRVPVRPAPGVLFVSKHRAREKEALRALGAGTAPFRAVRTEADLAGALDAVGGSGILKTSELGYDGKGQARVNSEAELREAFARFGVECVLEGLVPFVREVSLSVARSPSGEVAFSGLVENTHDAGILRRSVYPSASPAGTEARARAIARRAAEAWGLEGLVTFEFFELADGSLLVNEVAPRVHNSGHLTQDAGGVSQFEAQVRAVLGLPLVDFAPELPCVMVNVLGWEGSAPDWAGVLRVPGARLHLYHKANRPGRKVGHVNVVGSTREEALERAALVEEFLRG